MKKNMKIEINQDQPLDEVLTELKRLGYYFEYGIYLDSVICDDCGWCYSFGRNHYIEDDSEPTTLAELKEMK